MTQDDVIAVLGGTGPPGRGLARRLAAAGLPVVIGSRSAERAEKSTPSSPRPRAALSPLLRTPTRLPGAAS